MILYNRIELESLTLKGMKLQMQARQSELSQKLAPNKSALWPIMANIH